MAPRLSLTHVEKAFGARKVLHGVSLIVQPGEVHGLLGEAGAGAGKSTLLNILSGVLSKDSGGALRRAGGLLVDRAAQEAEARRLLAPLDPNIDVTAPIKGLRVAQRQLVEIAKALRAKARIIAMDEPTSSLTPSEFEKLVTAIAGLTAQGVSIIYVSHKMDEVFRVCQNATILRDGKLIAQVPIRKRRSLRSSKPWSAANSPISATTATPPPAS